MAAVGFRKAPVTFGATCNALLPRFFVDDEPQIAKAYRLENAEALTRIGAHVCVAVPGGIDDDRLPRATIPADEVPSWLRTAAPAPATTPSRP